MPQCSWLTVRTERLEEEGLGKPLAGLGKWKGMGPVFLPTPELSSWSFLEE